MAIGKQTAKNLYEETFFFLYLPATPVNKVIKVRDAASYLIKGLDKRYPGKTIFQLQGCITSPKGDGKEV